MPSSRAIAPAVTGWSPVIITVRMPASRAAATAAIASLRGGSAIPTTPSRRRSFSSTPAPDRDAQHAQAARRHVGVRLGGARRARRAQREQQLGRALDVEDAVRSPDGHPLAVGVERVHVPPRAFRLDRAPVDAALGGRREQRDLRRIAGAGAAASRQLGVAARGGGRRAARGDSAPHSSRTVITPVVSVPVLSVQMTVALPSVSTAGSRRMSTWRAAIRWTPIASAIVTIAGSPSGTAATASDTADMNTSSGGRPRDEPEHRR